MALSLRIVLFVAAVVLLIFIVRKIKKSQFEAGDALFWLFFAMVLVVFAVFPQIAFALSTLLRIESPSNLVFLCVIAILLVRLFSLNAKVAHLRARVNNLIQEMALRDNIKKER